MRTIGVLDEPETAFAVALIDRINSMRIDAVGAEYVKVSGVQIDEPSGYHVIVDQISQRVPFYRAYLKNAILNGAISLNQPFHRTNDDKFFPLALMSKFDVAIPPTVLLPPANDRFVHLTNWAEIFDSIGFPAFLKFEEDGRSKESFPVADVDEFFAAYRQMDNRCVLLQRAINSQEYLRCFIVGAEKVHIMRFTPGSIGGKHFSACTDPLNRWLQERVTKDCLSIGRTLSYDIYAIEFAVEDGIPYALDFLSPIPDLDPQLIGKENFEWLIDAVADLAVRYAREGRNPTSNSLLNL